MSIGVNFHSPYNAERVTVEAHSVSATRWIRIDIGHDSVALIFPATVTSEAMAHAVDALRACYAAPAIAVVDEAEAA